MIPTPDSGSFYLYIVRRRDGRWGVAGYERNVEHEAIWYEAKPSRPGDPNSLSIASSLEGAIAAARNADGAVSYKTPEDAYRAFCRSPAVEKAKVVVLDFDTAEVVL
ncbi:MAG: hypothetical protein KatS3mg082_1421 [Nitrospiraceae bacterium]|nr:MAG: hypothetical protein KatS3mg082_1421 [Nitrospiraceae bacterium]